jgi:hypothetical protein
MPGRLSYSTSHSVSSRRLFVCSVASSLRDSGTRGSSSSRSCYPVCSVRVSSMVSGERQTSRAVCCSATTASVFSLVATHSSTLGSPQTMAVCPSPDPLDRHTECCSRAYQEILRHLFGQCWSCSGQHCRATLVQFEPGARVPSGCCRGAWNLHSVQYSLRVRRFLAYQALD